MDALNSKIDVISDKFRQAESNFEDLMNQHHELIERTKLGGSESARQRQYDLGKMLVRERINELIDKDSEFLELSSLAAFDIKENQFPSAGIITGFGVIHGKDCIIIANDSSVKGGTYIEQTIKKHLRAQQIAMENHLPCVYLVDSGGVFLPDQSKVFGDRDHFGRFFYNQARMSAAGIPQIAVVMGACTAGGAYVPAMADEVIIVKQQGRIYIGGPPLVEAATGQKVSSEELGGAEMHTAVSGTADHLADNDKHALHICRNIFETLRTEPKESLKKIESKPPVFSEKELYGIAPLDFRQPLNVYEIIARLVDESKFQEFKARYGRTLVTGFAHIDGYPVGIIQIMGSCFQNLP